MDWRGFFVPAEKIGRSGKRPYSGRRSATRAAEKWRILAAFRRPVCGSISPPASGRSALIRADRNRRVDLEPYAADRLTAGESQFPEPGGPEPRVEFVPRGGVANPDPGDAAPETPDAGCLAERPGDDRLPRLDERPSLPPMPRRLPPNRFDEPPDGGRASGTDAMPPQLAEPSRDRRRGIRGCHSLRRRFPRSGPSFHNYIPRSGHATPSVPLDRCHRPETDTPSRIPRIGDTHRPSKVSSRGHPST